MNELLTLERLTEVLDYDQETGLFKWKKPARQGMKQDIIAGSDHNIGYRRINIDGVRYYAHRLAWMYVHGEMPKGTIDHINGKKNDNRICNLRDVSFSINHENVRSALSSNKCGFLGVTSFKGKFIARIQKDGKQITIGRFSSAKEAHDAYVSAKRKMHTGCTL